MKFTQLAWTKDSKGFYYSRYPKTSDGGYDGQAPVQTYFHKLGSAQTQDKRIATGIKNDSYIYTLPDTSALLIKRRLALTKSLVLTG